MSLAPDTATADTGTTPPPRGFRLPAFVRLILLPALLGALITTAILFVPLAGWTTNDVTTGQSTVYPDLQSRRYDSAPQNTTAVASAIATTLPRWKVVRTDIERGTVQLEVRSVIPVFTDDVTVTVLPTGPDNGSSEVEIRSHSRVGKGDLGANARHIRDLQTAMDDKLPRLTQ